MDEQTRIRAERNYRIGRLYYQEIVDSQGYPNGMAFWEDMTPSAKYHYALTGIGFLEAMVEDSVVSPLVEFGVEGSVWGKGHCAALMEYIEERAEPEKQELLERLKRFNVNRKDNDDNA